MWVMAWHWLSLEVAEVDLNWMVTERSDSQFAPLFAGLVNSWTRKLSREMQFLKSHLGLYQLSNANFPLHCKWICPLSQFWLASCKICWLSVVGDNRLGLIVHGQLRSLCSIYCCLVLFIFLFYDLVFLKWKPPRKWPKPCWNGCFTYSH